MEKSILRHEGDKHARQQPHGATEFNLDPWKFDEFPRTFLEHQRSWIL
jgi:hypothetical protein